MFWEGHRVAFVNVDLNFEQIRGRFLFRSPAQKGPRVWPTLMICGCDVLQSATPQQALDLEVLGESVGTEVP
jgi:hypothetical protein